MRKFLACLASLVILTGCATTDTYNPRDAAQVEKNVAVNYDDFSKTHSIASPGLYIFMNEFLGERSRTTYFIRGWKKGKEDAYFQTYITRTYYSSEWFFADHAYGQDGTKFDITNLSKVVNRCDRYECNYTEVVGFDITLPYLEKHQNEELKFKVYGKNGGHFFINFPPQYLQGFVKAAKQFSQSR